MANSNRSNGLDDLDGPDDVFALSAERRDEAEKKILARSA